VVSHTNTPDFHSPRRTTQAEVYDRMLVVLSRLPQRVITT
jgi:hypothetical protein